MPHASLEGNITKTKWPYRWSYSGVRLPPLCSLADSHTGMSLVCWCTPDCTHLRSHTHQCQHRSAHPPWAWTLPCSDNATHKETSIRGAATFTDTSHCAAAVSLVSLCVFHQFAGNTKFFNFKCAHTHACSSPFPVACCSSPESSGCLHLHISSGSCLPHPSRLHSW